MITRVLWVGLGAAIGVMAVRKVSEVRQRFGPEGLNRAVGSFADSVSNFTGTLRESTREREADLRLALGLDDAGTAAPTHAGTAAPTHAGATAATDAGATAATDAVSHAGRAAHNSRRR